MTRRRAWLGVVRPGAVAAGVALACGLMLGSCAPYVVPAARLDEGARQARFARALAQRQRGARMAELEASVWVRATGSEALPGMQARLLIAAPDAFRVRVESSFGTALDLVARGDSVTAYVPAAALGLEIDAVRDSLGLTDPGGLGFKLWSAAWSPPREAWESATWSDSLRLVTWKDGADSLVLAVGSDGLPRSVRIAVPARPALVAEYPAWEVWDGIRWPSRLVVGDVGGRVRVTCLVHRARFPATADPARVRLRLPEGVERLSRAQLMRLLERVSSS